MVDGKEGGLWSVWSPDEDTNKYIGNNPRSAKEALTDTMALLKLYFHAFPSSYPLVVVYRPSLACPA